MRQPKTQSAMKKNGRIAQNRDDFRISLMGFLILAVLVVTAALSTYFVMQKVAQRILDRNLRALLQDNTDLLRTEIHAGTHDAAVIATRPFVIANLRAIDRHPADSKAQAALRGIARSFQSTGFRAVYFYDARGRLAAHAGVLENPPFVVPIQGTQEAFVLQGRRQPLLRVAVIARRRGRRIGSVVAQKDLHFLSAPLPRIRTLGRTADLAVCAPLGPAGMRCFPDTQRVASHRYAPLTLSRSAHGRLLPMGRALAGQAGVTYSRDYENRRVIAAYAPVGHTSLGMVLKVRQREFFQPIWAHMRQVIWGLAGLLLGGGLLMRWLVFPLLRKKTAAEMKLRDAEGQTRAILMHIGDGVIVIDERGIVTVFNPAAEQIFGYSAGEIVGDNVNRLMPEPHRSRHDDYLKRYRETGEAAVLKGPREVVGVRRGGEEFPLVIKVQEMRTGPARFFIAAVRDITSEKVMAQRMLDLATRDALTGLPNRLLLADRLKRALLDARRATNHVAVLFMDLDNFKTINDSLGHDVGDLLLQSVAHRLTASLRATDTIARHGGDEFVAVLSGLANAEAAGAVIQKLLAQTAAAYDIRGQVLYSSMSIGVAIFPGDGEDENTLLKNGDMAMYQAKEAGGNTCRFFTPQLNEKVMERQVLSTELHEALERHELRLHYQPTVDLARGDMTGMEVLLRWQHPARGLVYPGDFVPLAEETGLILPIGEWVLASACAQWRHWTAQGLDVPPLAVNVSARQFHQDGLAATIKRIVEASALPPHTLVLEITESMLMHNAETAVKTLNTLRDMGIRIALDDFGTGYSSLGYLRRFPIDILKIDQSFVRNVTDPGDAAIIVAVVTMAHSLRMTVIAEGVETEDQRRFLKEHGCDQYQGYYYSKPLAVTEMGDRLKAGPVRAARPGKESANA